ncbi:variable surface lipoprotein [Mycoplasmopsis agalactiae]|uniref:Variable surface lipoprotein K (VpmaK) n=1 Tax=Mycoplasmopsis agalactiae TaxID=2110 RepID=C5JAE6_MYCAA|nr:variable surface lipoprotein [Mycoplasmopsis agalactiae]KAB6718228.1 variable surface lipoprotein [Mycoplasmopsis agalactiae]CAX65744.1 Variable surface lipoprotein K (vpmaK) [Mycoplasmopsis agalactiae]CBH41020.1 Variable surface lipoprotein K (vpmaK) [Mycoplasmopsis agalactiae]
MKKSKFLLLGSISSLAAIPFVAAKCGGTKEEEKKPTDTQGGGQSNSGGNQNPGTEGGSNQQWSEINVKALKDKINTIWGLAPKFEDRLQNSFKEGDTYQSVVDKIASKLGDKEKELVKLASDDKDKKLGLQAKQKIKIKVGTEEVELEFGKVSPKSIDVNSNTETNSNSASNSYHNELEDRPVNYVDATGFDIGRRFQRDFNELTKKDKQDILADVDELVKEIEKEINKKFDPYTLINTKLKSLLNDRASKLKSKIERNKTFDDADISFNELFDFVEKYIR